MDRLAADMRDEALRGLPGDWRPEKPPGQAGSVEPLS
jgi:hypothetical protein